MTEHGPISQTDDNSVNGAPGGLVSVVRVEVPETVAKWLLVFLVIVCLLSLMCSVVAVVNSFEIAPRQIARASESVDRASDRLEDNTRYLIQVQYWSQLVYAKLEAAGVKVPPPPKPKG